MGFARVYQDFGLLGLRLRKGREGRREGGL